MVAGEIKTDSFFFIETLLLFIEMLYEPERKIFMAKKDRLFVRRGEGKRTSPGTIPHVNMLIFDFTFPPGMKGAAR